MQADAEALLLTGADLHETFALFALAHRLWTMALSSRAGLAVRTR